MILPPHPPAWAWSHLAGAWSVLALLYVGAGFQALLSLDAFGLYVDGGLAFACLCFFAFCQSATQTKTNP